MSALASRAPAVFPSSAHLARRSAVRAAGGGAARRYRAVAHALVHEQLEHHAEEHAGEEARRRGRGGAARPERLLAGPCLHEDLDEGDSTVAEIASATDRITPCFTDEDLGTKATAPPCPSRARRRATTIAVLTLAEPQVGRLSAMARRCRGRWTTRCQEPVAEASCPRSARRSLVCCVHSSAASLPLLLVLCAQAAQRLSAARRALQRLS